MSLTDTLKKEHAAIKALLEETRHAGIATDEGQQKLVKCKALLLAHLKKEDADLYPALKNLEASKDIASAFQDEMKAVSKAALEFFDKYQGGGANSMEFARDFGAFNGALGTRIRKEEVTLYPKYDQFFGRA